MIRPIGIRPVITGAALAGTLAFGAAGVAGATTSSTPAASMHTVNCTKAEARATKIEARETKAATWVTAAQGREAAATAADHPKVAARIARRITRVQKLEARGTTILARISAKCGPAS